MASSVASSTGSCSKSRLLAQRREAEHLAALMQKGDTLTAPQARLVEQLPAFEAALASYAEIEHIMQSSPPATPSRSYDKFSSGATPQSAAASVASAIATSNTALQQLQPPPPRISTRATAMEVARLMAAERAQYETRRLELEAAALEAERALWLLLRSPFDAWEDQVCRHSPYGACD
jgi:hypothetical protein